MTFYEYMGNPSVAALTSSNTFIVVFVAYVQPQDVYAAVGRIYNITSGNSIGPFIISANGNNYTFEY